MKKATTDSIEYLVDLTHATAAECRIADGAPLPENPTGAAVNALGLDVVTPASMRLHGYCSYWLRDFVMSVPAGISDPNHLKRSARLFASSQRDEDWIWYNGRVPAFTPAEHINMNGGFCYYPGSYFPDERQGGRWGPYPPMDSAFYFIHLIFYAFEADPSTLDDAVNSMTLYERALRAFDAVEPDPETGLCRTTPSTRCCDFGFTDAVYKIGLVLFGSCLKFCAAEMLGKMAKTKGDKTTVARMKGAGEKIQSSMSRTFGTPDGMLLAATEVCRQPDVWGTAFAIYSGALKGPDADTAARALRDAYVNRTAVRDGAVRHIRHGDDWSDISTWEYALSPNLTYQNGGYWLTPSGWYIYAVSKVDPDTAMRMFDEMIKHLRQTDFRNGDDCHGPYEWHNPKTGKRGHAINLTSVACPAAAVQRIVAEGLWD